VTLEEALTRVPGWDPSSGLLPSPLQSGKHNRAFRVQTRAGDFVVRLQAPGAGVLGVDRARESTLSALAAAHGIAPALVYAEPDGLCSITQFVCGEVWSPARMREPAALRRLAEALRSLHSIPTPEVAPFDVLALMRQHCERLGKADPAHGRSLEHLLRAAESQYESIGGSTRRPSIVHNDLHHSNIIDGGGLILIDWEYAAVTDPLFDLACVLAYYPETQTMGAMLLEHSGLASSATVAMLRTAAALFRTLNELWARVGRLGSRKSEPHLNGLEL